MAARGTGTRAFVGYSFRRMPVVSLTVIVIGFVVCAVSGKTIVTSAIAATSCL